MTSTAASMPTRSSSPGTVEQQRAAAGDANTLFLSAGDNIGASLFASAYPEGPADHRCAERARPVGVGGRQSRVRPGLRRSDGPRHRRRQRTRNGTTSARTSTRRAPRPPRCRSTRSSPSPACASASSARSPRKPPPWSRRGASPTSTSAIRSRRSTGWPLNSPTAIPPTAKPCADRRVPRGRRRRHSGRRHPRGRGRGRRRLRRDRATTPRATVNAIFTGHTHKQYAWDAPIPGRAPAPPGPIVQTGSYGENIGKIVLTSTPTPGRCLATPPATSLG